MKKMKTFCNPLDLNYAYRVYDDIDNKKSPVCLEAADPVIVTFKGEYYLFSSITKGYWVSDDLSNWDFIHCDDSQLPNIYNYAPAAMVLDGAIYFHQGLYDTKLYRNKTPKDPNAWELVTDNCYIGHDPFLYYDEIDDRVWASYGCGPGREEYIKVVELDRKTLEPIGKVYECLKFDPYNHGWERNYDEHLYEKGWTEGSQILRHNNKWYLIYSGFSLHKSYANGVYVSDSPTGPYEYATNNPVSHKNTGFVGGAGHGCLFEDKYGNWWNVTCASIHVTHAFERRINMFPAGFDEDGMLYVNTSLGDYPISLPEGCRDHRSLTAPYMLLSKDCSVTVSSVEKRLPETETYGHALALTQVPESRYVHDPKYITDEDIRTLWAADSREERQFAVMDLGRICEINAIQINIPTYNLKTEDESERYHEYTVEVSEDGNIWRSLIDNCGQNVFAPHAYFEAEARARYVKITFIHVAGDGFAAISGMRIFGHSDEALPEEVTDFTVTDREKDMRNAKIRLKPSKNAEGYIVRYGISPEKLYNQYQIYTESVEVRTLNVGVDYWFRVDSFNSAGITFGKVTVKA